MDAYQYHYEEHWCCLLFYFCKLVSFIEEKKEPVKLYTPIILKKQTQLLLAWFSNNQTEKWTSYFVGRCLFLGL